ncbi:MAG: tetratricopeptide repeat protein [Crocinitomicaceae bacterium]|nr:tetratricopeptide repeat protein [Crocinitomicaceae bacterium]MBK8924620.1 tetratricopeptide repeat protein [Crocinitomicaceae bacterium]
MGLKSSLLAGIAFMAMVALTNSGFSQTDKQMQKASKVFLNKSKIKGIDMLVKYIYAAAEKGGSSIRAYELWVNMEYIRHESVMDIDIEVQPDENGEIDSAVYEYLDEIKESSKQKFLNVCRKSTLESLSYTGDIYLRKFLVDYDPDTAVSEKAKEYFKEGEEFFSKEDYELAELNYRKAWAEDSTYYAALLYLGDTFWAREDYDSAIVYFTLAKNMHPLLLEPRKYIVDALIELELFYRAKKECLEAFTVYPGYDMKFKLQRILSNENKWLNEHRFLRYFYPNNIKEDDQRELSGIFATYREAKSEIKKYCNDDGIIEPNGVTDDKYLEVYSYRKLLEKHQRELPEYMDFAYKMMEDGYLDCFVFISLFHVDIYPQFKDFMSYEENRTRSLEFIEKYLIEVNED